MSNLFQFHTKNFSRSFELFGRAGLCLLQSLAGRNFRLQRSVLLPQGCQLFLKVLSLAEVVRDFAP